MLVLKSPLGELIAWAHDDRPYDLDEKTFGGAVFPELPEGSFVETVDLMDPGAPDYDPNLQTLSHHIEWRDGQLQRVYGLTDIPIEPPRPVVYRELTKLQFLEHLETQGVDLAALTATRSQPDFAGWWLKFEMATGIERDHPSTQTALNALIVAGLLTEGQKVSLMEGWPQVGGEV